MQNVSQNKLNAWTSSRSGAWAGRGFHYQHLIIAYLVIRQWCGDDPAGTITPEGLEDCVIELPDREIWVQIKSRHDGEFADREFEAIYSKLQSKSDDLDESLPSKLRIVYETSGNFDEKDIKGIYDAANKAAIGIPFPNSLVIDRLTRTLEVAPAVAESIFQDIYTLIAETSEKNARVEFPDRRRISVNEIERRIVERLTSQDPSAINAAIKTGALQTIDFITPVNEPNFYMGVKVRPGHIAANLVAERSEDTQSAIESLWKRRNLLFAGPSGAGKTAILWLTAQQLSNRCRWFEVGTSASADDVQDILNFITSRRPSAASPIALAIDDVGSNQSDLWNILIRELRGMSNVYLLGSLRQEDMSLISERSETEIIQIALNETLAEFVWKKLSKAGETDWKHWREPFEQSNGLMLEFTHILTQGKRLAEVIFEQVQRRAKDKREDELKIIRVTSAICARGGEVQVQELFDILGMAPEDAAPALKRLVDEHLVREDRPGVLGGLHLLRSKALRDASHDELIYLKEASVWRGLPATTAQTLPQLVQSLFSASNLDESIVLQKLADFLSEKLDPESWISVLTGLGLATLVNWADVLIASLEKHGVDRTHWTLASMFSDPDIDMPELSGFDTWGKIWGAVHEFKNENITDLRVECLALMDEVPAIPIGDDPFSANRLLACLSPLANNAAIAINIDKSYEASEGHEIDDIAALLSTAKYVNSDLCDNLIEAYGGEQNLLSRFAAEEPWLDRPNIGDDEHGRTVRADLYWIDAEDDDSKSINNKLVRVCEILMSLSPNSDAAACQAITPDREPIQVGEMALHSKNMPRENLPAKTRVAWNVAFKQVFLAKAGQDSLTYYASEMSELINSTEKLFRQFSERWIKGKSIANADVLASEIGAVCSQANALAYAAPSKTSSFMEEAPANDQADDTLGALLTGILQNLVKQMSNLPSDTGGKAAACNAGELSTRAAEYKESDVWRVIDNPPLESLQKLSERLLAVSRIVHEMANEPSPFVVQKIVKAAKRGRMNNAINSASVYCQHQAERRFQNLLGKVQKNAAEEGLIIQCYSRPINDPKSIYWPPREIAVAVSISDFETDSAMLPNCLELCEIHIGTDYTHRIVPLLKGSIIPSLAVQNTSFGTMLDLDFVENWYDIISNPILVSEGADAVDEAIKALSEISAVVNCRPLNNLHPAEETFLEKSLERLQSAKGQVTKLDAADVDEFSYALHFIDQCYSRIAAEVDAKEGGNDVSQPLWREAFDALNGEENEWTNELAGMRVLLRQSEATQ